MKKSYLWMQAVILTTGLTVTSCTDQTDNPAGGGGTTPPAEAQNIEEPSDFASFMDTKTYAGDDFYQYAVGKWLADNPLGKDESEKGTNSLQAVNAKNFLLSLKQKGDGDEVLKYLIDAYDIGTQTADLNLLREKLATIDAVETTEQMWELMADLTMEGYQAPYYVGTDNDQRIVGLFLDLPRSLTVYDCPEDVIIEYGNIPAAEAKRMLGVVDRWKDLLLKNNISRAGKLPYAHRAREIHPRQKMSMTRAGAPTNVVEAIVNKLNLGKDDYWGSKKGDIICGFLGSLTLDELKDFTKYAVLNRDVVYIPHKTVDLSDQLYTLAKAAYGPMNIRISALFNKTIPEANRTAAVEMANMFRDTFKERVQKRTWMTDESKARAIEKVDAMNSVIGWLDDDSQRSTWEVSVPEGKLSFYQAVCDIFRQNVAIIRSKINLTSQADQFYSNEMEEPSYTSNAFYSANNNEILILASNLVPPIFDASRNAAINYAVLGATTIGHEITHGFDNNGKNYNKYGKEEGWMLPIDTLAFNELAQKMIAHFDKQTFGPLYSCDGKLTLGENIADLGGLYIGYDAFQKYLDKQGIAGAERDRQLREFFRAFAYSWMTNSDDESIKDYNLDVHSIPALRVNGNVYQLNELYRLFNITSGARYLAPEKRIEIW